MINIDNVSKEYVTPDGVLRVLDQVTLEIPRGQIVLLLGPSGCGKSTLLRMIAGLEQPSRGTISVDGNIVREPGRDRVMVFQSYTSFPWLSVRKNVELALHPNRLPKAQRENIARYYIDKVGLGKFENYMPRQLSGGMRQRVAIARALAVQSPVLLLDEPFGALDALTRAKIQEDLLHFLAGEEGTTVVFVTHDAAEAVYLADRILVFSGRPAVIRSEDDLQITDQSVMPPDSAIQQIPHPFFRHDRFRESDEFAALHHKVTARLRKAS